MADQSALAVVEEAWDRWVAGDLEGFLALWHDDGVWTMPGQSQVSGAWRGHEEITKVAQLVYSVSGGTLQSSADRAGCHRWRLGSRLLPLRGVAGGCLGEPGWPPTVRRTRRQDRVARQHVRRRRRCRRLLRVGARPSRGLVCGRTRRGRADLRGVRRGPASQVGSRRNGPSRSVRPSTCPRRPGQ